jgi:transcriptional regulator with XRE-family HTH domain
LGANREKIGLGRIGGQGSERGETVKKSENVGSLLRERRLANALNQTELGERLKVSQATVSLWEQGKGAPKSDQLEKLNEILGGLTAASESVTEAESQTPVAAWLSRALVKKDLTVGELAAKADVSVPTVYNILSGRAQNPHPRTISALEKALGDTFESKDETREASKIAGIGQLIDFNPYDEKEIPGKAGVYVLYDISQRPIYVGKASKIALRLNDHSTRFWFKRPLVETGAYIEIPDAKSRDQIETVLIQFLKNNAVINKQKTIRDED